MGLPPQHPINLFSLEGLEPPAGDLGIKPRVSACRAIWTAPLDGEDDAPARRIIHARTLRLHAPATLHRLGIAPALGYHKCGSHIEFDWVRDVRVLLWDGWPCGYEGLLTDQFGILATAIERYGSEQHSHHYRQMEVRYG